MRFRILLMIGVTLVDMAFCTAGLRGAQRPDFVTDFIAGMSGNTAAFERAMKTTEEILTQNPKDAQAEVWHGSGLLFRSGGLFRSGDEQGGSQTFDKGLKQMDDAVALAPSDLRVLIPRGATLLEATLFMPQGDDSTALLKSGLQNYLQALNDAKGPVRARLLFGIADAYYRLGDTKQAETYFRRVSEEAKGTGYQKTADTWLSTKSLTREQESCSGCDGVQ